MKSVGLERKLLIGVAGMFLVPTVVVEAILILLYRGGAFEDPLALLLAVLVGLAALMVYLAWVAHSLGRAIVGTIETIRHGTELMATVNPDHRIEVRTRDELEALSEDINRLADHVRDARLGLEARVAGATQDLDAERAKLASVLSELAEGVVVATLDGRVTLANRAAQELLNGGAGLLGRSLFEFVERQCIAPLLDRLDAGPGAAERFTLATVRRTHLFASMTAFRDGEGQMTGFILALRDSSHEVEGPPPAFVRPGTVPGEPISGAGLRSGVEAGTPGPPRSELYDFSLLTAVERHVPGAQLDLDLATLVFVVFDVETTGLAPEAGDRVVSLAGVRVREGVVRASETFDALVQPERPIPPVSTRFHGITDAMVAAAPPIDVVLPAFARFAQGAILVGHEVSFDLGFLGRDTERLGIEPLASTHPVLDTRLLSRLVHWPSMDHSLEAVARRLGVVIRGRHSALGDALATAEVLVRLIGLLERRGIRTLGQVVGAVRAARFRV